MDTDTAVEIDMSSRACVTRGVQLLDLMRPDWRHELRGVPIVMSSGTECVAARLHNDHWTYASEAIGRFLDCDGFASRSIMAQYGFVVLNAEPCAFAPWEDPEMDEDATDALLPLWQAEINRV
jgi:hypothetical protein